MEIVESARAKLEGDFRERFDGIFANNPDFGCLGYLLIADKKLFKSSLFCNADVERSFSTLKIILSDRRQNLSEENIKRLLSVKLNCGLQFKID